jgi:dynein heavy chain
MMRMSVRQSMLNAVEDYPKRKRPEWSISHPGQVILNGSQIVWTNDVEKALKNGGVAGVK